MRTVREQQADQGATGVAFGPVSAVIIRRARAHRALAAQLMSEVGLRPDQAAMMMHLWEVGAVRQTALSAHFSRDSAATTRTVQRLEKAGYVRRRPDPTDGRATLVEPTPAGNALRAQIEARWMRLEVMTTASLRGIEADAMELLRLMADSLTAEVHRLGDVPAGLESP